MLGTATLPTRLFRGQPVVKVDYAQLFNTSRLETTTLRATLGCVHHGVYDTALLKLRYLDGVWQPEPDFFTCDSLPKEWIEHFEQLNRTSTRVSSPSRVRPPSARQYFAQKPNYNRSPTDSQTSTDQLPLSVQSESVAPSSPVPVAADVPQPWTLKVHVDQLTNCASTSVDECWVEFSLFGRRFETFRAHSSTTTMPIVFNSLHRLRLRASQQALEKFVEEQDSFELAFCSKLAVDGSTKTVTVDIQ